MTIFDDNQCQEMVVVLPVDILADLLSKLKKRQLSVRPIRAVMLRKVRKNGEVKNEFSHFERIVDLTIVTQPL